MTSIFNSLGSNYTPSFMWRALVARGATDAQQRMAKLLSDQFGGEVTLAYKGRQALLLALQRSDLPIGSRVAINGFTCYVVYQAIERAGHQPILLDTVPGGLHFDIINLEKLESPPAAVIIQNTFGYPCDILAIERYCKSHKILLIEDLAHGSTLTYADGRPAGSVGDFVMLSFSQDKSPDVVAGGALIDRRSTSSTQHLRLPLPISYWQNRFYPILTGIIRATFQIGVGRILRKVCKRLKLLSNPLWSSKQHIARMSPTAVMLLVSLWKDLPADTAHRRLIAKIYQEALSPAKLTVPLTVGATPLRFPIFVKNPNALLTYLRQYNIHLADTWYDAPMAPARCLPQTNYKAGDCPESEQLVSRIVNLPTHRQISEVKAKFIAEKVRVWLTLK